MPEGKNDASSGSAPEEKPTRGPTVFVPPSTNRSLRPHAMPTTPTVLGPTAIPGVARERITVTPSELRTLSPGVSNTVCEQALRLIGEFRVDTGKERKVILWGHDLQVSYSALVTDILTLSQAPVLVKVDRHLNRMTTILGSIDLVAACGHGNGPLASYFRGLNTKIDTPEELRAAHTELNQLVTHMTHELDELLVLKDSLEDHSKRIDELATDVEASALAALFLSEHLRQEKGVLAQRFTERSMSLTQCLVQIRESGLMRETQIEQPLRMVSAVQHTALVALPGFLGSIASVTTLSRRSISLTEASELHDGLQTIINQLKA